MEENFQFLFRSFFLVLLNSFITLAHIQGAALLFIFPLFFAMQIHDLHGAQNPRYFFVIITLYDPFNLLHC